MGKRVKKGVKGAAANYITRTQAVRKLQLPLKDFRRLCILKGIYPREPSKATKGKNKTYYLTKDILFLSHEPLLRKFRDIKSHMKRVKKAYNRFELTRARKLYRNTPGYTLDHVVKERYPSFVDALRDLDDALTLVHLFATFPTTDKVEVKRVQNCQRLAREFQYYILRTHGIRKVFLSLKGIYYQAEVMGQTVTWIVPYEFSHTMPSDVDYRVMLTFLEFYETMLDFVNFRLFSSLGLQYPPKLDLEKDRQAGWLNSLLVEGVRGLEPATGAPIAPLSKKVKKATAKRLHSLQEKIEALKDKESKEESMEADTDGPKNTEAEEMEEDGDDPLLEQAGEGGDDGEKMLFDGLYFFLGREVPKRSLEFVIRAAGGEVAWEEERMDDTRITHVIMDRPTIKDKLPGRIYVQPQWVYDSINNQFQLPPEQYSPEVVPPPHLSPFADDERDGYEPDRAKEIERLRRKAQGMDEEEDVHEGKEQEAPSSEDDEEEVEEEEEEEDGVFDTSIQELAAASDHKPTEQSSTSNINEGQETQNRKKKLTAQEKKEALEKEEKERGKMMMTKKQKRLYERMQYGIDKKKEAAAKLMEKRKTIQKTNKTKTDETTSEKAGKKALKKGTKKGKGSS